MIGAASQPDQRLDLLYPPLAPALHAWACTRISSGDRARVAPEDLTQEVWLRALQVFDQFDPKHSTFRAWLFAVAKNVLLELRRRLRHARPEQAPHGSTSRLLALDQVPLEITTITRRLTENEDLKRFVDRLHELDPVDRQTALHCGLEGMAIAEAAIQLGENPAATAKRWQRLRASMRAWAAPLGLFADD